VRHAPLAAGRWLKVGPVIPKFRHDAVLVHRRIITSLSVAGCHRPQDYAVPSLQVRSQRVEKVGSWNSNEIVLGELITTT
jgi:hypothetical protein